MGVPYSPLEVERFISSVEVKPKKLSFYERCCGWAGRNFRRLRMAPSEELKNSVQSAGLAVGGEDVLAFGLFASSRSPPSSLASLPWPR